MPPDQRAPLSDFLQPLVTPPPTPEERRYGTELLKRGMWQGLGVDYNQQRSLYDDSPTVEAIQRQRAAGQPTMQDLREREMQMENWKRSDEQSSPRPPPPRNINLQPMPDNFDPFSVHLVPVHEDPFQSDPYTAAIPTRQDPLGIGNAIADRLALPRRVMEGVQPENPGVMDEATAYRMNQLDDQAGIWASRQAMSRR